MTAKDQDAFRPMSEIEMVRIFAALGLEARKDQAEFCDTDARTIQRWINTGHTVPKDTARLLRLMVRAKIGLATLAKLTNRPVMP